MQIRLLLAANGIIAMLLDRHLGRDRIDVTFFGRPTGFLRTPAMIGYLSGAPLLPAFMIRQADDRFVGAMGDPIESVNRPGRAAIIAVSMITLLCLGVAVPGSAIARIDLQINEDPVSTVRIPVTLVSP